MSDANTNGKVEAIQTKYNMPNATHSENEQQVMKVEIVGVNLQVGENQRVYYQCSCTHIVLTWDIMFKLLILLKQGFHNNDSCPLQQVNYCTL